MMRYGRPPHLSAVHAPAEWSSISHHPPLRPRAANDQCDSVCAVIGFYLANDGTADGVADEIDRFACSLRAFITPEGYSTRGDEILERIELLSCMFEDILCMAAPGR